jgi:putative ABC transport system permease protein
MLDGNDRRGAPPVILINDSMRRRYWGDRDPLGARLARSEAAGAWSTVVGVVGDVRQRALDVEAEPEVIVPYLQYDGAALYRPRTLAVRTRSDPAALIDAVRREIGAIDPAVPLPEVVPMDRVVSAAVDDRHRLAVLLSASSALALLLAILGVYAVVAAAVTDRTQEIGVRIAIGADPVSIVWKVIGQGVALAALGCAAGLLGALGIARLLESFLFGVTASDPVSFGAAAVLVLSIAAAASYVPARRTTTLNLRTALYYE